MSNHGLRGHETVIRLVGKRRKLTRSTISLANSDHDDDKKEDGATALGTFDATSSESVFQHDVATELPKTMGVASALALKKVTPDEDPGSEKQVSCSSWVQCPICLKSIRGDVINSHLDICLQGGVKDVNRKRKQLTIWQFRGDSCNEKISNQSSFGGSQGMISEEKDSNPGFVKLESGAPVKPITICYEDRNTHRNSMKDKLGVREAKPENTADATTEGDNIYFSELQEVRKDCLSDNQFANKILDDKVVGMLDTKIVGRRFNRGVSCKEGTKVTCLRDPDNPKDPNAIKIVLIDAHSVSTLGHLAREISLHLCGLLDKGLLQVSGFVTALPEQNFGAVPVRLCYKSTISKEDFLRLDGAEEGLQNTMLAVENFNSLKRSPAGVSKYQQNFLFMLQTVLERDVYLFKDDEKKILETFSSMSDDSQRLFIRLYQRRGPWFRISNVEYGDVADVSVAAEDLLGAGFMTLADRVDEDCEISLRKRFETLTVLELRQFFCTLLLKKKSEVSSAKKDDLVNMAVSLGMQKHGILVGDSGNKGGSIFELLAETTGRCIRVSDTAEFLLWRLQRLFFLNGNTDLSAFLLVDMGLIKYPRYRSWRTCNIFATRAVLLAYEQALEVAQRMDMALECNDMKSALELLARARSQMLYDDNNNAPVDRTPTFLARFSASYVYRNVCTLGVSILERERRYLEAVDVLRQLLSSKTIKSGRWGYWTVRLSMDLEHLGRKEESLQVAEEGVNDPWIRGGDRVTLQRRVVRLGKPPRRWKKPPYAAALKRSVNEVQIQGRPLNCVTGVKSRFYGFDGQQCGVEELALQYYASEEGGAWQGVHCEGGVWMTLFGLLMWDVLFADVPDVFQTSFQTAPLDLDTEVFFPSRQNLIMARLAIIAQGDVVDLLTQAWNENFGTTCQGVNWERHSLEELQTIASCIGGSGLAAVCQLLAEDHAGWTAGMPDLLLWRTQNCSKSENPAHGSRSSSPCFKCGCCPALKGTSVITRSKGDTSKLQCALEVDSKVPMNGEEPKAIYKLKCATCSPPSTGSWSQQGEAKLVEVKGPRDRLSEQQTAWIWLLMNAGLDVEVCKVREDSS